MAMHGLLMKKFVIAIGSEVLLNSSLTASLSENLILNVLLIEALFFPASISSARTSASPTVIPGFY